jgi:WD40 repeat protein
MSSHQHQDEGAGFRPNCIASTADTFNEPIQLPTSQHRRPYDTRSNLFRKAVFTADGTTIVTQNEDHRLRSFILPTDLLEHSDEPKPLVAYDMWKSGGNILSYAIYPGFDLQDPATTLVLCGQAESPVTLRNALHFDTVHASYPLVHPTTEIHHAPASVMFNPDGTHFMVGSDNLLALFDCTRAGDAPILRHKLSRGRLTKVTSVLTRKAAVSALSTSCNNCLALGTRNREIAFFEQGGLGQCVATFLLDPDLGTGVSDLKWSPCGKYLLVAERQSNVVQVYDVRDTGQKVTDLTGRYATTCQTLHIDVVPTASGYEAWAGGTDGVVRMWNNPGSQADSHAPDAAMKLHETSISTAVWHPSGTVLATASGNRFVAAEAAADKSEDESEDESEGRCIDNSMRIWTI